jgi:hypothetical protein
MTPKQLDRIVGIFLKAVLWACLIGVAFIAAGCTSTPSEEPSLYEQQQEQERRELFVVWRQLCRESGGYIYINRSYTCSINSPDCIPHRIEWKGKLVDTASGQQRIIYRLNTYRCVRRPI